MQRALFDDDHEVFRDSVRRFVDANLIGRYEEFVGLHGMPREVWLEAGKLGLLGLAVPERLGGGGTQDWRFLAIAEEELTRASLGVATMLSIHYDVVAPYLTELTTDEQQERWLPRVCSGELITAIAMTEPGGGSDLASLRTTAVRDGDDWVLDGAKTFITNGAMADLVIVAARTDPAASAGRAITLFGVERGTPGFAPGTPLAKVGMHDADTAELSFQRCRVPAANQIGEQNHGFAHMMRNLAQERVAAAVQNLSHARWALEATLQYCRDREAFGQPIGRFQHNAFVLADLVTEVDVVQAYVDACIIAHTGGDLTPVDAAKAKLKSSEVQGVVLDSCVQLHGGYGFMAEYPVARAWADARATRIYAGTNEVMRLLISRELGF